MKDEIELTEEQMKKLEKLKDQSTGYRVAIDLLAKQLGIAESKIWKKIREWYPEIFEDLRDYQLDWKSRKLVLVDC